MRLYLSLLFFLIDHPDWVHDFPEQAKKYMTLLEQTQLSSKDLTGPLKEAYISLLSTYGTFFTQVKLTTTHPEKEYIIPRNLLMMLSDKFQVMFSSSLKEGISNQIELDTKAYEKEEVKVFFNFIQSGQVNLTGENVLGVLLLGNEHGFKFALKLKSFPFQKR